MELIVINSDKMKVMLNSDDMKKYNLQADLALSKEQGERILNTVLHDAFEKCGFKPDGGSLYIQIFPSKKGGCELFVTKKAIDGILSDEITPLLKGAGKEADFMDSKFIFENEENVIPYYRSGGVLTDARCRNGCGYIYCFDSLEQVLQTCREAYISVGNIASRLYIDIESGTYYLSLETDTPHASEFGGKKCTAASRLYISEHCRLVCDGAVSTLHDLAI